MEANLKTLKRVPSDVKHTFVPENHQSIIQALLQWFLCVFVPEPKRGYAVMNPPEANHKYSRKNSTVTPQMLADSFNGETRRLQINNTWQSFPLSLAVVPEHREGWAMAAILDVDEGGQEAVERVLACCKKHKVWAFAQLGQSNKHNGGHIYIPSTVPLPTGLLQDLAQRIKHEAGIEGEAYPCNADLRLPLQVHLQAPDGPVRFPLMLQNGETIDATDPWNALATLKEKWSSNSTEAITEANNKLSSCCSSLPSPSKNTIPTHKSKVVPDSPDSIINWYNSHHDLQSSLRTKGMQVKGPGAYHCPYHDDKHPSFVVWRHHRTEQLVGRCFSEHSNCPAELEEGRYLDPFGLYCLDHNLDPKEAVKQIAQEADLGQKRSFKIETPPSPSPTEKAIKEHQKTVIQLRGVLSHEIHVAIDNRGEVTVLRVTPGGGKTFQTAAAANQIHEQGKSVAIVAPSHNVALSEWAPHLKDPFIWKPRLEICTCYPKEYLQRLANQGYTLPKCKPGCAYKEQYDQRQGRIAIYQHNHLHLNNGQLLAGYDVIIIDESPLSSFLQESTASQTDLHNLTNRIEGTDQHDPSLPLLRALLKTTHQARQTSERLQGQALIDQLAIHFGSMEQLLKAINQAEDSPFAKTHTVAPQKEPSQLHRQFFGKMLSALKHDAENPAFNPLLSWTQVKNVWCWCWHERHQMLQALQGRIDSPAILVLDGSAKEQTNNKLFSPWPTHQVSLDIPLSPAARIIQCPTMASTRQIIYDEAQTRRTIRTLANICNNLDLFLDGGVTYLDLAEEFEKAFGGPWLYYGGQRGSNALLETSTIALVASPTTPPDAIERKTMALYSDEAQLDTTSEKKCVGYYKYNDPRLEEISQLHGLEELYQSLHRARPILSTEPTTILVASPWPLDELGITPHQIITQTPHGNSLEVRQALDLYQERLACRGGGQEASCKKIDQFNTGVKPGFISSSVLNWPKKLQRPPPISLKRSSVETEEIERKGEGEGSSEEG